VKLRTGVEATRRLATGAQPKDAVTSAEKVLSDLVENGRVRRVVAVFGSDTTSAAPRRTAEVIRSTYRAPSRLERSRGLLVLELDRDSEADALVSHLTARGDIEYAYVPAIKYPLASRASYPNDPLFGRQWNHKAVKIHEARAQANFRDCESIIVAVVDTGVDRSHPDLAGSIESYTNYLSEFEGDEDYEGHGTHVSGIISAITNNDRGIAGLCAAKIQAIKGLPRRGQKWRADRYYQALGHVIDHKARILNLSLGGDLDPGERDVIEDILAAGIVVVAAMGNEYERGNPTSYPAAYDGVIAVAATDEMDMRASFSSTGSHVALGAPGVGILSTVPGKGGSWDDAYDAWDGPSMAAPHVAAAAALLLAANDQLSPAEVRSRLVNASQHVNAAIVELGAGRLDFQKLMAST
jgi:subtilisin family serine protease